MTPSLSKPGIRKVPALATSQLLDVERSALSYAYFDKQFEIRTFKDMAGIGHTISGWDDITDQYDAARNARLHTAMESLHRFGLVEQYYEHHTPGKERIVEQVSKRIMKVRSTGYRYRINDEGKLWLAYYNARIYRCCEGCVVHNCVCLESTFCAEHGGGCHGTHE